MTDTTPAQARNMANSLELSGIEGMPNVLRSLADQLEAVTAELEKAKELLNIDALAFDGMRKERDAYKLDAERYRWLRNHPAYMGWEHDFRADEIDRAVDAAIAKEAK